MLHNVIDHFVLFSINELLKIKDDLTKERDEKLQEITKVKTLFMFIFCSCIYVHIFLRNNAD